MTVMMVLYVLELPLDIISMLQIMSLVLLDGVVDDRHRRREINELVAILAGHLGQQVNIIAAVLSTVSVDPGQVERGVRQLSFRLIVVSLGRVMDDWPTAQENAQCPIARIELHLLRSENSFLFKSLC